MGTGIPTYVNACFSNGRGMASKIYLYLRPNYECMNKSRKVSGFTKKELFEKAYKLINKWYSPKITLYEIDGWIIGSNTEENALREWWRICDKDFIGIPFPVTLATTIPQS